MANDKIVIHGARAHNLKILMSRFLVTKWLL